MKRLIKSISLSIFLVSPVFSQSLSSYYIGVGNSDNSSISDANINGGFNINFTKNENINFGLETGLSLSNNDNNYLDLLPEISYKSQLGTFSIIGGLTVGYVNKEDVVGSSYGIKYLVPLENHNLQISYKKSSLETSTVELEDIDRLSVNYIHSF